MFNSSRKALRISGLIGAVVLLSLTKSTAQGIPGFSGKGVTYTHYEGALPRALVTARDVKPMSGANVLALDFGLATFRDGNPTNIEAVIEAPECIFNTDSHLASSTNRVHMYNGATNLFIEGRGFSWQPGPTNIVTISNDVHTVIQRLTNAPVAKESALNIYSDRFRFLAVQNTNINTRIAYYNDHVRAEDPEIKLTAESLTADLSATNNIRNIVAETNVVIVNKADDSQATGERAVYVNEDGKQILELTGNPHWHDAKNEGRARRFFYDRTSRVIRLEGDAQMTLPGNSVAQPDLLGLTGGNAAKTNEPITVSGDLLKIHLSTNKLSRVLTAEKNVVIVANNTRAVADSGIFKENTGILRLTNATWGGEQFIAKGALLTFDRSNKVFHAEQDAFLKLPAKSFGEPTGPKSAKSKRPDNRFIEIVSDEYDIRTNISVFHGDVRVTFPETNGVSTLKADHLTAYFTKNKIQKLIAESRVDMHQKLSTATNSVERQVNCEKLTLLQRTNGTLDVVTAEQNVIAEEFARNVTKKNEVHRKLSAAIVQIHFASNTNQIEKLTADRNVYIERNGSWGQGDHLVYTNTATTEVAELLGNPRVLWIREAHKDPISITDAQSVVWDIKADDIHIKGGVKAHGRTSTNSPASK